MSTTLTRPRVYRPDEQARLAPRAFRTASPRCVSFRLNAQNVSAGLPLPLWTDLVVSGSRVYIRTQRPVELLDLLCGWANERGTELPELEVSPTPSPASRMG